MPYFYLSDGSTTISLDANATSIDIGGTDRDYKVFDYAASNGGFLSGSGSFSSKTITISRKDRANANEATAWNELRSTFVKWFARSSYTPLYFYIDQYNDGSTNVWYTQIYPSKMGADKMDNIAISSEKNFSFISPSGVFLRTASTTVSDNNIEAGIEKAVTINVDYGNIDCPAVFSFTPDTNASIFRVEISNTFGFTLEKTNFLAGEKISYNTADNTLTIDGETEQLTQYLTSGSVFNLQPTTNTVYVYSDSAGDFECVFYPRRI